MNCKSSRRQARTNCCFFSVSEQVFDCLTRRSTPQAQADYRAVPFRPRSAAAEIGITAPTAWQIAQIWMQMSALLSSTAAGLEGLRLGTIAAFDAATTVEIIGVILTGFQSTIEAAFSPS